MPGSVPKNNIYNIFVEKDLSDVQISQHYQEKNCHIWYSTFPHDVISVEFGHVLGKQKMQKVRIWTAVQCHNFLCGTKCTIQQ